MAPLKTAHRRAKLEPWFNDATGAVRRECGRAERSWKKDKLQVSFLILKDRWRDYQTVVKEAKRAHLAGVIESNRHNPRVLFNTTDSVSNAPKPVCQETSIEL